MIKGTIGRIGGALAALALLAAAQQATAAVTFSLGSGNPDLSGYTGPYGTVTITWLSATSAKVELTAKTVGSYAYSFGDGGTIGLNLAGNIAGTHSVPGTTYAISSVSGTTVSGGSLPSYQVSAGNEDGFGNFNFQLDTSGSGADQTQAFKDSVTSLTFTITQTGGTDWADENSILAGNNKKFEVAGHVFVRNASDNSNTGITGFATTPEPSTIIAATLLLLPFGASTLRVLRRNRAA